MSDQSRDSNSLPRPHRRAFLRLLTLGGGATLLAACQPNTPAAPTAPPAKPAAAQPPAAQPAAGAPTTVPPTSVPKIVAQPPAAAPAKSAPDAPQVAPAAKQTSFYAGKTINIATFTSPGGPTELMLRLVMKYLPKHTPGNPQMGTVEYMRGGGGLVHANHVYTQVRPDGLTLAQMSSVQQQWAVGDPDAKFDLTRFELIADILPQNHRGLALHGRSGIENFQQILDRSEALHLGVQDIGHNFFRTVRHVEHLFGNRVNFNQVPGYDDDEIDLAIQRGELDGRIQSMAALFTKFEEPIKTGEVRVIFTTEEERFERTPNVPTLFELANQHARPPLNQEDRNLFDFLWTTGRFARYYSFPPGTPSELVSTMRQAFKQMTEDPDFRREFEAQTSFVPTYTAGDVMLERFKLLGQTPQSVKDLYNILGTTNPLPARV